MSVRLPREASWVAFLLVVLGCGGSSQSELLHTPVGESQSPSELAARAEWPAPAQAPDDAMDVEAVVACAEGTPVRVRAYLVAVTVPCPACNVGERTGTAPERMIGKSSRPRSLGMPGCLPCPNPAATFRSAAEPSRGTVGARDESGLPLRAVGVAEGLQSRHVGKRFLLTGTWHATGATGPELDVTDIRALNSP